MAGGVGDAAMQASASVTISDALGFLAAWGVMMAAMMVPSAIPMIALYGAAKRNFGRQGQRGIPIVAFAAVYVIAWALFGVPVYLIGKAIAAGTMASPSVGSLVPIGGAVVLVAAGIYQLTPLKRACLSVCQHPVGFLFGHWRTGYGGTLRMALDHAVFCIGCCWALMAVLVAAGAMSIQWVLLIAVVVFVEKIAPRGDLWARIFGVGLILLGVLVVARPEVLMWMQGSAMGM
jgi:predicted metal-binding membrane protein